MCNVSGDSRQRVSHAAVIELLSCSDGSNGKMNWRREILFVLFFCFVLFFPADVYFCGFKVHAPVTPPPHPAAASCHVTSDARAPV